MRTNLENTVRSATALPDKQEERGSVLLILVLATALVVLTGLFIKLLLSNPPWHPEHRIFGMILLVLVALILFFTRKFRRLYYAVVEIAFGVAVAWSSFDIVYKQGVTQWLVPLGAAYILVRGFDNLDVGLSLVLKRKRDRETQSKNGQSMAVLRDADNGGNSTTPTSNVNSTVN